MGTEQKHRIVQCNPDGTREEIWISQAEFDAVLRKFEEEFDPETFDRRWIVEARKKRDAKLSQQSEGSNPPTGITSK